MSKVVYMDDVRVEEKKLRDLLEPCRPVLEFIGQDFDKAVEDAKKNAYEWDQTVFAARTSLDNLILLKHPKLSKDEIARIQDVLTFLHTL